MNTTSVGHGPFHERVVALSSALAPGQRRVAEYMATHPDEVATSSATQLADLIGTSDATVVRTVQALGYSGLRDVKKELLDTIVRRRDPARVLDHRLNRMSKHSQLDQVLAETIGLVEQLRQDIDPAAWEATVDAIVTSRAVLSYGIGPAGCIADYMAIMLGRIGVDARSVTRTGFGLADGLISLRPEDAVMVFAPLRLFREVEVVIAHAREVGATVLVISEALGTSLASRADVVIATPQSTINTTSETMAGFLLTHALTLSVAARTRDRSIRTMELLNHLRSEVAGRDLDADPL